jgi:hypothetical protein
MTFDEVFDQLSQHELSVDQRTLRLVDTAFGARDSRVRVALEAAAIPHSYTASILARLLETNPEAAAEVVASLAELSFVKELPARPAGNVHNTIRRALRLRLHHENPEYLRLLSQRAAQRFYGEETVNRVEALYHGLYAHPEEAADELEQTYVAWDRSRLQRPSSPGHGGSRRRCLLTMPATKPTPSWVLPFWFSSFSYEETSKSKPSARSFRPTKLITISRPVRWNCVATCG